MPVQTTVKNFLFPDGCQVLVKEYGASTYTDIGAINSQVANSISFDENQLETANAGTTEKQINNMKVEVSYTLVNWDMEVLEKISGVFDRDHICRHPPEHRVCPQRLVTIFIAVIAYLFR